MFCFTWIDCSCFSVGNTEKWNYELQSFFTIMKTLSQPFSLHSHLEMTKTLSTISHASLQAYNSYTHMPKLKLHSLLLAFLNNILPTLCTLIFMIIKLKLQLQLKFCQVLISNEINSRPSILYLIYRLIIIISSEMFFHESCISYHHTEFALCLNFYLKPGHNTTWRCCLVLNIVRFLIFHAVF